MAFPANLFWTHPTGDPTTTPCTHIVLQHPNGDRSTVPCTHIIQAHPNGDPNPFSNTLPNVPCTHLQQKHPRGDVMTTPCIHPVQQHPGGDNGPDIPCLHGMPLISEHQNLHLKFYTSDIRIQNETITAAQRLKDLGINIGSIIRPLNIFNRPPINGDPNDPTDPFWSHYESFTHSIQITRGRRAMPIATLRDIIHHEMGHATIGQCLIQIANEGQPHAIEQPTGPAEAMSEGWAHFIALVIRFQRTEVNPTYFGKSWGTRDANVACSPNIEYNVGCMLWDLLDEPGDGVNSRRLANDDVILPLSEMFRVYSPTLTTIFNTPILNNVGDYLTRLENNNSALRSRIERVRRTNCC